MRAHVNRPLASLGLALIVTLGAVGCAGKKADTASPAEPDYPDPGFVVDAQGNRLHLSTEYTLETPEDFAATEVEARAAMHWYIHALPPAKPELWMKARDLVYDWIEKQEDTLGVRANMAVLGIVERDRKWKFTPYVRGVYLAGKTLYVLDHPGALDTAEGAMAAEVAAVEAMFAFHEVTSQLGQMGDSPKLLRYARKYKQGKLEAYLQKRIDKGKD